MLAALPRRRRSLTGFTLIELLIVIIIIGILVAIGVPAYLKYTAAANDRDAQAALRTAYKAAVAGDSEVSNARFPSATSIVADVEQDEPAASVARGDCIGSVAAAPVKQVLVDPASTASQITLCTRSASGTIWRLTGPLTGTPAMTDVTTVAVTFTNAEMTDAVRAASQYGDGLPAPDSSTGVWDGATNITPNGGFQTGTGYWSGWAIGSSPVPNLTQDTSTARFGSASMRIDTQGANATEGVTSSLLSATTSTTYTVSAWVKGTPGQKIRIGMDWKNSGAYISGVSSTTTLTGSSWQRITDTATSTAATNEITATIYTANSSPTPTTFWVDGVQVEAHPIATPYVETSSGAATRAPSYVTLPATGMSTTQGWVALRLRPEWSSSQPPHGGTGWEQAWNWGDGDNDELGIQYAENGSSAGRWELKRDTAGVFNARPGYSGSTVSQGVPITLIAYWTGTGDGISLNGGAFQTAAGTRVEPFANTSFALGHPDYSGGNQGLDGEILWFACGAGTLTDADAATISSWGDTDPKRAQFPAAAQAEMVWDGTSPTASLK